MNNFIPSTKDLISALRPQAFTAPQKALARDNIGFDDALDDWVVTWDSIENGALPVDRLPSVVARRDQANTFSQILTAQSGVRIGGVVYGATLDVTGSAWFSGYSVSHDSYCDGVAYFRTANGSVSSASIDGNTGNATFGGNALVVGTIQTSNAIGERIVLYDGGAANFDYGFGIAGSDLRIYTSESADITFRVGGYSGTAVMRVIPSGTQVTGNLTVSGSFRPSRVEAINSLAAYPVSGGGQLYLGSSLFDNSGYFNSAPGIGAITTVTGVPDGIAFYSYTGVENSRTEVGRYDANGNWTFSGPMSIGSSMTVNGTGMFQYGLIVNAAGLGSGNIHSVKSISDATSHLRLVRTGVQGWSINQAYTGLEIKEDGVGFDAMQILSGGGVNVGGNLRVSGTTAINFAGGQTDYELLRIGNTTNNADVGMRIGFHDDSLGSFWGKPTGAITVRRSGSSALGIMMFATRNDANIETTKLTLDSTSATFAGGVYVATTQSWINFPADNNNYLGGITRFRSGDGSFTGASINGEAGTAHFTGEITSLNPSGYCFSAQNNVFFQMKDTSGIQRILLGRSSDDNTYLLGKALNFCYGDSASNIGLSIDSNGSSTFGSHLTIVGNARLEQLAAKSMALRTFETSLYAWQEPWRGQASASGATIGFLGASPIVRQTLPAAATDAATTQTLANALRSLAINFGLAN